MITILGLDPGSRNYGYGCVSFRQAGKKFQYRVNETGLVKNTVTEMKEGLASQLKKHVAELRKTVKKYKVEGITIERFMTRGNGGNLIELVGVMIGAWLLTFKGKSNVITAATWKNRVNAYVDLKGLYAYGETLNIAAHEIDATCMAFYGASKHFGDESLLKLINKKLVKRIGKCSTTEIKPKRQRKKKAKKR